VDQTLNKVWHVYERNGQNHQAVFLTRGTALTDPRRMITIELQHNKIYEPVNLGRFRLSVSGDAASYTREQLRFLASKLVDPISRLAAVYHLKGDQTSLEKLLKGHPAAAAVIGDQCIAVKAWAGAIEHYSRLITDQTRDSEILFKRSDAYFASGQHQLATADALRAVKLLPSASNETFERYRMAGRWTEAVASGLRLMEQQKDDVVLWGHLGAVFIMAGDDEGYGAFCHHVTKLAGETPTIKQAVRATQICVLRPGAIKIADLPSKTLVKLLDEGNVPEDLRSWAWSTRALLVYRSGDAESALTFAEKTQESQRSYGVHALASCVTALAHHELQHPEEALKALEVAAESVKLAKKRDAGQVADPDTLIAEILLREVESKLTNK
jgi:tetratricopeptide (TPR) repeat protein